MKSAFTKEVKFIKIHDISVKEFNKCNKVKKISCNISKICVLLIILFSFPSNSKQATDVCLPTSKCNETISCSDNGHCFYDIRQVFEEVNDSFITCICDRGYTDDPDNSDIKCCYKKKSQFTAFLLEVLLGFGIGHFYIKNYTIAIIKLIFQIISCCSCCLIGFCFCYKSNKHNEEPSNKQIALNINFIAWILLYIIWQFIDLILFGINFYNDGNGVSLESW